MTAKHLTALISGQFINENDLRIKLKLIQSAVISIPYNIRNKYAQFKQYKSLIDLQTQNLYATNKLTCLQKTILRKDIM